MGDFGAADHCIRSGCTYVEDNRFSEISRKGLESLRNDKSIIENAVKANKKE
jgi:hypothetical protein